MVINISVQYNGELLPDIILLTQGYYNIIPSGNPFKYHVEALSLKPMKQYIITIMLDVVLQQYIVSVCFRFLSGVPAWRLM